MPCSDHFYLLFNTCEEHYSIAKKKPPDFGFYVQGDTVKQHPNHPCHCERDKKRDAQRAKMAANNQFNEGTGAGC